MMPRPICKKYPMTFGQVGQALAYLLTGDRVSELQRGSTQAGYTSEQSKSRTPEEFAPSTGGDRVSSENGAGEKHEDDEERGSAAVNQCIPFSRPTPSLAEVLPIPSIQLPVFVALAAEVWGCHSKELGLAECQTSWLQRAILSVPFHLARQLVQL
eukprot:2106422-Amphidinium_carterae.1